MFSTRSALCSDTQVNFILHPFKRLRLPRSAHIKRLNSEFGNALRLSLLKTGMMEFAVTVALPTPLYICLSRYGLSLLLV